MAMLFVVATPIGNRSDITLRAIETLKSVHSIFAEDTRVTAKLLSAHDIHASMVSYHQHSDERVLERAVELLRGGHDCALVSDAGTPGINDPGQRFVAYVLAHAPEVRITPIPGANAAVTLLSVSGFPSDRYVYLGFAPHKKGRKTFFRELAELPYAVVFYESKYRIEKTLSELGAALAVVGVPRPVVVGRELTKQFETIYRGTPEEILATVTEENAILGEFAVVVGPQNYHQHHEEE